MSDILEGLVCTGLLDHVGSVVRASGTALRFRFVSVGPFTIAERIATRDDGFSPQLAPLAASLSLPLGPIALFHYDSRVAYRAAILFAGGAAQRSFGLVDERWVPLSEDGEPVLHTTPVSFSQIVPGEEYTTIANAIDLALQSLTGGQLQWSTVHSRLSSGHGPSS